MMNLLSPIPTLLLLSWMIAVLAACNSPEPIGSSSSPTAIASSSPTTEATNQPPSEQSTAVNTIPERAQGFNPIGPIVTPTPFPAVMTDTSKQVEAFEAFWQTVEEHYVYPDFNGVDWAGIKPEYQARVDAGMTNPEFWQMLDDLIILLNDEHSYFVSADEVEGVQNLLRGEEGYAGVGVSVIGRPRFGDALVAWAIPGNGAAAAGIRNGDRILRVDGFPICCDGQGQPFEFLLGSAGSTTEVEVQSPGEEPRTVTVTRNPIEVEGTVQAERLDAGIGYIQIHSFLDPQVNQAFRSAWDELNQTGPLDGLILDLRSNTGGLVIPTTLILSLFVDGTIYYYYEHGDRNIPRTMKGEDVHNSQTIPLVVLVGEATNSQAEVFSGVLHDTGRATLIGGSTYGNVETLNSYDLPDGSQVFLADDSVLPLSGDDWETNGLTVDIVIDQRWSEIENQDNDKTLNAAIRFFE